MRPRLAGTVFALLLGVSLVVFLTPGDDVPESGPNDKVTHMVIFVVLAAAGRWAGVAPLALGLGLAAYAGVTEVLQAVLPIDRHGDVRDLFADLTGVLIGLLLSRAAVRVGRVRA